MTLNGSNAGSVKFYKSTSPALYLNTKTNLPTGTYTGYENKDSFTTSGKIATSEDGQSYQETDLKKSRAEATHLGKQAINFMASIRLISHFQRKQNCFQL